MAKHKDAAARIEKTLVEELLRGQHAEGSKLPTVRELAERFGVNASTVQRALARLETTGLVVARQGSGIRVEDPYKVGEVSLAPQLLEVQVDNPPQAARFLGEILLVRRGIVVQLVLKHRDEIIARGAELATVAAGSTIAGDPYARLEADMAFARKLLEVAGDNRAAIWLLNTVHRVLEHVPHLAGAYYGAPEEFQKLNFEMLHTIVTTTDPAQLGHETTRILTEMDAGIVRRFEQALIDAQARA